eukprot:scaffold6474_cov139-Isochrysis_galbana.AAC.3
MADGAPGSRVVVQCYGSPRVPRALSSRHIECVASCPCRIGSSRSRSRSPVITTINVNKILLAVGPT